MVLTQAEDVNVLHNYQLVVVFMKDCAIHNVSQIFLITLGEEHHGLRVSFWCIAETLPVRVFADTFQNCANSISQLALASFGFLGRGIQPLLGANTCSQVLNYVVWTCRSICLLGQLRPSKSIVGC
jgi:hypothetical protein